MKVLILAALVSLATLSFAQGHNALDGAGMKEIAFLQGDWEGKQDFNTGGAPLVGKIVNHTHEVVGGRYFEEVLSTTMPGRKPTDVRHFITFDPTTKTYKAWWFNDTSMGPMEFDGTLQDGNLVFQTKAMPGVKNVFRATYKHPTANSMVYTFELQKNDGWQLLFTSTYSK